MSNPTSPGAPGGSSAASSSAKKKSLIALIGDLPGLVGSLIRDEIEQIKKELTAKLVSLGIGAGLFAGAAFFAFFAFAVLIAAAVLGIATALPGWLAALIVAAALLVITAILVLIGVTEGQEGRASRSRAGRSRASRTMSGQSREWGIMTDDDTALSHKERALGEIRSDIESTREKLAQTLDAIEDKLNVPKQVSKAASKARDDLRRPAQEQSRRALRVCRCRPRGDRWSSSAADRSPLDE